MVSNKLLLLILLIGYFCFFFCCCYIPYGVTAGYSTQQGFDRGFDELEYEGSSRELMLNVLNKHRSSLGDSETTVVAKDLSRIQALHTRMVERKRQEAISGNKEDDIYRFGEGGGMRVERRWRRRGRMPVVAPAPSPEEESGRFAGQLVATLKSGVSLGSGEYLMDVFIGTPPKHYSLILDTGSDLNWIQCHPCYDCFKQKEPHYDPKKSSSFRHISCSDPRCQLVSSIDPTRSCMSERTRRCPYYYWYGDNSNTTGDFALETFTVNLTKGSNTGKLEFIRVENVMFGCGHWNRGLFNGAAGVLGLGRGPLSFASQLQSLYGQSFSYCLVDRNSNESVSSKLIFGENEALMRHPRLNFTKLVGGKDRVTNTFYYVEIKSVLVGGEELNIPPGTLDLASDGGGGTIIDSGATLTYFADPAYKIIKEAFMNKMRGHPVVRDNPVLDPCYKASDVDKLDLPSFGFVFGDGAVWNFPAENYFIKLEPDGVVCLAILGTPRWSLSIIGNYQQQNFHILYDTKRSVVGFAPTNCTDA